jgi:hypothetical protein
MSPPSSGLMSKPSKKQHGAAKKLRKNMFQRIVVAEISGCIVQCDRGLDPLKHWDSFSNFAWDTQVDFLLPVLCFLDAGCNALIFHV